MCTYNGERFLSEQLQSLAAQTRPPAELVVYDDASTDHTLRMVRDFASRAPFTVRVIPGQKNLGVNQAFAKAIAEAGGEYIALCDQDDVWFSDKLEQVAAAIAQCGCASGPPKLFVGSLVLADQHASPVGLAHPGLQAVARKSRVRWQDLAFGNLIPGCAMVFERRMMPSILPVPQNAVLHDWWIALCFAYAGEVIYVAKAKIHYRVHSSNQQGVPSLRSTVNAAVRHGPRNVAANNAARSLAQLRLLHARFVDLPESQRLALARVCELPRVSPLLRPFSLFASRVCRRSFRHTLTSYLACIFVSEKMVTESEKPFV